MEPAHPEIICIIDRSGSMDAIVSDAIGGFNRFLSTQQSLGGEARFTLVLFNHEYELVHQGVPIGEVRPLDATTYVPSGTTALLDAVGRTIEDAARRHETMRSIQQNDGVPGGGSPKAIVAILTDGLENASRDYTRARVAELVERQTNQRGWQFVFLAANQDAFAEARSLHIDPAAAIAFDATGAGVQQAYAQLGDVVRKYRVG